VPSYVEDLSVDEGLKDANSFL